MRRAFVYRLYPTKKQTLALTAQLDATRHLYNAALEQRRLIWQSRRETLSVYEQKRELPDLRRSDPSGLGLVHTHACQEVLFRLDRAFRAFFRRVKTGDTPGYPRFKGRDRWDSLVFSEHGNGAALVDGCLRVFGIGHVNLKLHRPIAGTIKTVTLKRNARQRAARLHEKAREQRRDFHHKLAHRLVREHELIAVEGLKTKDLIAQSSAGLAKSITDAARARFLTILGAKAAEAGRSFVTVPPRGTSSTCSGCGRVEPKVLSERAHRCPCGLVLDRDHNAALNILRLGRSRREAADAVA